MQTSTLDLKLENQGSGTKPKRILVIRSAARVFGQTLELLKSEFPESHIVVLASELNCKGLEADPLVDEVKSLPPKGRISIFSCKRKVIRDLRSRKFDLAVPLYNVERGIGYSNIDLLAWSVNPKEIRGYNCKGAYVGLTGKAIFEKMVLEKTSIIWVIANFMATVVLFAFITFGVAIEWAFRKMFQSNQLNKPIR
tara:strand:- start:1819 stop:2406 length:588 start_codon:yes stop_codon:yes gene_type:complete